MIRILCSTNECITQARQLEAARLRLAAAEAQATRLAAERDAMAGELAAARDPRCPAGGDFQIAGEEVTA